MSDVRRAVSALRWLRERDTRRRLRGRRLAAIALGTLVLAALVALLGPAELTATRQGGVTHYGGWPVETAFTALLLVAAVLTYRVVDVLFRTDGARAIDLLPVPGAAFARDRLGVVLRDGMVAGSILTLATVPLLVRPGAELALAAIAYVWLGIGVCVAAGFGTIASAGAATADPEHQIAQSLDAAGQRAGTIFHFAPGAAFGVVAALLLFLKLGIEEPLRAAEAGRGYALTRAFQVAVGAPLLLAAFALVSGLRGYARHHHALQARFREADSISAGRYAERTRAFRPDSAEARHVWRDAFAAQLSRRHALLLPSSWVAGVVGVLVAWALRGQMPPAALSAIACFWLVLVVHPARRAAGLAAAQPFSLASTLPGAAARAEGAEASVRAILRQHLLPVALPAVALGSLPAAAGHVAALAAAGVLYGATGSRTASVRAASGLIAAALVLLPLSLLAR